MATLIRKKPSDSWYDDREYWAIGDRFELTIHIGENRCNFFIDDKTRKLNSLKITPKILEDLGLLDDQNIKLGASIDTCNISTPRTRCDEIFKLIENYLLNPKKISELEYSNFYKFK